MTATFIIILSTIHTLREIASCWNRQRNLNNKQLILQEGKRFVAVFRLAAQVN